MRHLLQCFRRLPQLTVPFRTVFTDPVRRRKLDAAIEFRDPDADVKPAIEWKPEDVLKTERDLRKKLRAVDFVIEVRDARISVSTMHPALRGWAGKKPRIMVFNKTDLISHRDRLEWERYFEEKNMHVCTSASHIRRIDEWYGRLHRCCGQQRP